MSTHTSQKALVLVHGFLGASNNWLSVVAKLRARLELSGWEIVCPNLRWHSGDSNRFEPLADFENPPSTSAVAIDLAQQLSKINASQFLLLGHSFGLRPLIKILSDNLMPEKTVLGLIAEDSSPELSAHGVELLKRVLIKTPVPFVSREIARQFFDQNFGPSSALSRFLLSNIIEDQKRGGHVWRFPENTLIELLNHSVAESLKEQWVQITTPVYMIVGERSEHLSHQQARHWCALRDQVGQPTELHFVAGAGHWVHSEKPDRFVDELVRIVKVFN